MDGNYLFKPLKDFFKEVSYFNGNLYVVEALIKSRTEEIKSTFSSYQELWMTGTFFRDLSLFESESNLFPTGYGYDVSTSTLEEQSLRSVSYVCCSSIANLYEVFDSYLKNVLANVYLNSDQKLAFKLKETYNSFDAVRSSLWQIRSEKGFFKVLRRISPHFVKHEKENIWNINMIAWYSMIDKVRHQIIHNRQLISIEFCNEMKKTEDWKIFKDNFSTNPTGEDLLLIISYSQTVVVFNTFLEYAYLIFKSLSIDLNMEFQYNWEKAIVINPMENVYPK